jgi:hypothetical protein
VTPEEFQALPVDEQSARIKAAGRARIEGLAESKQAAIERAEQKRLAEDRIPETKVIDRRTSKRSQAL